MYWNPFQKFEHISCEGVVKSTFNILRAALLLLDPMWTVSVGVIFLMKSQSIIYRYGL